MIPPNIAPINFTVKEKGTSYAVKISSGKGEAIEISGKTAKIMIPERRWHKLLAKNRGSDLNFDIFVKKDNGGWVRFAATKCRISNEDIDGYVVYRRLHPIHTLMKGPVGIYQRNLANYDEKVVLDNRRRIITCVNCHSFCANRPDKMLMGVRSNIVGAKTLLEEDGKAVKINTKLGYTSWHPSGKIAAYSINYLPPMFFHTVRDEIRDTFDMNSAIAYFDTATKTVKTAPQISIKDRLETWPAWSGDGRYLYFCVTGMPWKGKMEKFPPEGYKDVKYDLARISYDVNSDKWGEVETVLSSKDTGLSIAMPKISPDNRWLTFCMCDRGYFPTWETSSDLYIADLKAAEQTGRLEYRRLEINSDQSESWLSWSSNSRWIVFSSKRDNGVFTRCYLSYVDEAGRVYKPIAIPQKDPEFYNYCLETFNTPEFVTGPIETTPQGLARIFSATSGISVDVPITGATPTVVTPVKADGRVQYE
jgi:hypothetical protein